MNVKPGSDLSMPKVRLYFGGTFSIGLCRLNIFIDTCIVIAELQWPEGLPSRAPYS